MHAYNKLILLWSVFHLHLEQCLICAQHDILKTQKFSKVSHIVVFSFQFSSKLTVENLISRALHDILKSQLDAELTTSHDCNAEF